MGIHRNQIWIKEYILLCLWTQGLRKRGHSEGERSSIQSVFLEAVGDGGENTNSIVNSTWASGYDLSI